MRFYCTSKYTYHTREHCFSITNSDNSDLLQKPHKISHNNNAYLQYTKTFHHAAGIIPYLHVLEIYISNNQHPLLSNDSKQRQLLVNGRNRFLTRTNGLTGKQCSLTDLCDSYVYDNNIRTVERGVFCAVLAEVL
jgi:hypothetical protein